MPDKIHVSIAGDKKLLAKFARVGSPKVLNGIVRKGMRSGLKPLLATTRANVPTDSGTFKKLVKIRTRRSRKAITLIIGFTRKELDKGQAGKQGFYPIAVEFGSKDQEPQAPFRRGFDAGARSSADTTVSEIRTAIIAEAKK